MRDMGERVVRWLALPVAVIITMLLALPASASDVYVQDDADVLDAGAIQSAIGDSYLQIDVWTSNAAVSDSSFNELTNEHTSSKCQCVMFGIDTESSYEDVIANAQSGLSDADVTSAVTAFKQELGTGGDDYTSATIAAVRILRDAMESPNAVATRHEDNATFGIALVGFVVLGSAILIGVAFHHLRRESAGGQKS